MIGEQLLTLWTRPDDRRSRIIKWAGFLFWGLILGVIAPYDSVQVPPLWRYAYWLSSVMFGFLIARPVAFLVLPRLVARGHGPLTLFMAYAAALSVPIFLFVIAADVAIYFGLRVSFAFSLEALMRFLSDETVIFVGSVPLGYVIWYLHVLAIVVLVFGNISLALGHYAPAVPVAEPAPAYRAEAGHLFLRRLPDSIGKELSHLSMEDHYVRAHTARGDTLLFMRLSDAIDELGAYPGAQVHRSWWVAFSAVDRVTKEGRRHQVTLRSGARVPVSKTYLANLSAFLPEGAAEGADVGAEA
ncbi:MAG: LytTR family transcriptional regulator [Alphaproteobacteria bacterium]|nr:MAG: LytTR family transcriptional regulator [Alphaproteobacteria bacterium]